MTERAIYDAVGAMNRDKCVPPVSDADVRHIAKSVMRYAPAYAV